MILPMSYLLVSSILGKVDHLSAVRKYRKLFKNPAMKCPLLSQYYLMGLNLSKDEVVAFTGLV